jgi:hypothetical protein
MLIQTGREIAIKHIIETSGPSRVAKEIQCLDRMRFALSFYCFYEDTFTSSIMNCCQGCCRCGQPPCCNTTRGHNFAAARLRVARTVSGAKCVLKADPRFSLVGMSCEQECVAYYTVEDIRRYARAIFTSLHCVVCISFLLFFRLLNN